MHGTDSRADSTNRLNGRTYRRGASQTTVRQTSALLRLVHCPAIVIAVNQSSGRTRPRHSTSPRWATRPDCSSCGADFGGRWSWTSSSCRAPTSTFWRSSASAPCARIRNEPSRSRLSGARAPCWPPRADSAAWFAGADRCPTVPSRRCSTDSRRVRTDSTRRSRDIFRASCSGSGETTPAGRRWRRTRWRSTVSTECSFCWTWVRPLPWRTACWSSCRSVTSFFTVGDVTRTVGRRLNAAKGRRRRA